MAVQSQWPGWENERLERCDSGFKPPDKRAWTRWSMCVAEFGMKTPSHAVGGDTTSISQEESGETEGDFDHGMSTAVDNLNGVVKQQKASDRDGFADSPVRTSRKTPKNTGNKSKGGKPKYHNTGKRENIHPLSWEPSCCPKACV